jgi:uncharacterized protein HemX
MDVDPKPQNDQSPTPPDEPHMTMDQPVSDDSESQNTNEQDMATEPSEVQPRGEPNPVIASALEDEMNETPEETEPQTQSVDTMAPVPSPVNEKKSRKPLVIGLVVIALIIIAGLAVYVLFGVPKSNTATDANKTNEQTTTTPATNETSTEKIDAAVDAINTNATEEATAADTDDSTEATDASKTAANVGDSINEDDF